MDFDANFLLDASRTFAALLGFIGGLIVGFTFRDRLF